MEQIKPRIVPKIAITHMDLGSKLQHTTHTIVYSPTKSFGDIGETPTVLFLNMNTLRTTPMCTQLTVQKMVTTQSKEVSTRNNARQSTNSSINISMNE